jgi:hypothetical protein
MSFIPEQQNCFVMSWPTNITTMKVRHIRIVKTPNSSWKNGVKHLVKFFWRVDPTREESTDLITTTRSRLRSTVSPVDSYPTPIKLIQKVMELQLSTNSLLEQGTIWLPKPKLNQSLSLETWMFQGKVYPNNDWGPHPGGSKVQTQ